MTATSNILFNKRAKIHPQLVIQNAVQVNVVVCAFNMMEWFQSVVRRILILHSITAVHMQHPGITPYDSNVTVLHINIFYLQGKKISQDLQWMKHIRKTTKRKIKMPFYSN